MTIVTLDSTLVISDDVVSQELEGELVLLSLDRAEYFGLNLTGTRVWHWLRDGATIHAVAERLASEYQLDAAQAQADVLALAQSLVVERLATIKSGVPPGSG